MCKGCFAKVDCCQECGENNDFLSANFQSFQKSPRLLSLSLLVDLKMGEITYTEYAV